MEIVQATPSAREHFYVFLLFALFSRSLRLSDRFCSNTQTTKASVGCRVSTWADLKRREDKKREVNAVREYQEIKSFSP